MPVSYAYNGTQFTCTATRAKLNTQLVKTSRATLSLSLSQIQIYFAADSKKQSGKKSLEMEENSGLSSMKFFSDQHLSYADIIPPHEVSFASNYQNP